MQSQPPKVSSKAFSAKFNSKYECYYFLTVECKAYLPPIDNVTIYFVRMLLSLYNEPYYYSSNP